MVRGWGYVVELGGPYGHQGALRHRAVIGSCPALCKHVALIWCSACGNVIQYPECLREVRENIVSSRPRGTYDKSFQLSAPPPDSCQIAYESMFSSPMSCED